jgi:hypothetical protein
MQIMNNRQRKTLAAVFANPIPKNLAWADLESLLRNIGCDVIEGDGSRVGFECGAIRLDLHRPHPGKEAKPYQIRLAREFLKAAGVVP